MGILRDVGSLGGLASILAGIKVAFAAMTAVLGAMLSPIGPVAAARDSGGKMRVFGPRFQAEAPVAGRLQSRCSAN
jgi:hypothetical protein